MSTKAPNLVSTAISLPKLRIASKSNGYELRLHALLSLDLPEELRTLVTAEELLNAVTEKHLWIARKGACHLNISVSVHDELLRGHAELPQIAAWVQECEFWDRLGLRLQYSGDLDAHLPGQMTFSIQHPDLSSALVAPNDALVAEFRAASCFINFLKVPEASIPPQRAATKRTKKRRKIAEEGTRRSAYDDGDLYECLTDADRRAIDEFISSLNFQLDGDAASQPTTTGLRVTTIVDTMASADMPHLLQTALKLFFLGASGNYKGIKVLDGTSMLGLKELIPAVMNVQYLKAISDRSSLLPFISTSLARMRHAESPALRAKVASLGLDITNNKCKPDSSTDIDKVIRGIEKSAWNTMLVNMKAPPLTSRRKQASSTSEHSNHVKAEQSILQDPGAGFHHSQALPEDATTSTYAHDWTYSIGQVLYTTIGSQGTAEQLPLLASTKPSDLSSVGSLVDCSVENTSTLSPFFSSVTTNSTQSDSPFLTSSDSIPTNPDIHYKHNPDDSGQIYDPGVFGDFDQWLSYDINTN